VRKKEKEKERGGVHRPRPDGRGLAGPRPGGRRPWWHAGRRRAGSGRPSPGEKRGRRKVVLEVMGCGVLAVEMRI